MSTRFLFATLLFSVLASAHVKDTIPAFSSQVFKLPSGFGQCDACGCSASGGSMGFSSMLSSKYVGIRYLNLRYETRDGIFDNSPWASEIFNTLQVWTKFPVGKKIQLIAMLRYHAHERERATGTERISGLGDLTVLGYITAWKTKKDSAIWKHSIQVGGGLKAPTGKYDTANNTGSVNPSFQIGTGSWDYLVAAEYSLNFKKTGLMINANYDIKTENEKDYRFGNQLNYGATVFRLYESGRYKLMPQAGIAGEKYEANHQFGLALPNTAGNVVFGRFGFEAGSRNLSIGLGAMLPIAQNLNDGKVEAKYRWSLNLNYSL